MAGNNQQLAALFQQMADILEITGANRFRVNAFVRAARVLEDLAQDVTGMAPQDLSKLPGIGKGMAKRIVEFAESGAIAEHRGLLETVPTDLLKMLDIPGLGPKTVALLWKEAGIETEQDLRDKLEGDQLAALPGMGKKKIQNLRKNLRFMETASQRVKIGVALPLAKWFVHQLNTLKAVNKVTFAGSLRRGQETIGDIDLLVAANPKNAGKISDAFVALGPVTEVILKGPTKTSIRTGEDTAHLQVDLRIVAPASYGAALMYFTGSKEHNIAMRERAIKQRVRLNEYGLIKESDESVIAGATEEDVFEALGLAWTPPELRAGRNEIALAESNSLPKLIEHGDLKAELHAHTRASDGHWTIRELALAAAQCGFHTVAVTDHSKGQAQANGLDEKRLEKHIEMIHEAAAEFKKTITILAGTEVDILADGKLDYPDSLLSELDIVVASPHVALSQDPDKATRRLLRAIENPFVTIIGHPTGRLIGRREGLSPDMKKLIDAAAQRSIAMEINANYWRLDLRDSHARAAIEAGVKLSINTDAHGPGDFGHLGYGVLTARRAGATKKDVINCMSRTALAKWIKATRD